jgi:cyclophilin family peptidyl-prolyl cis-trans isomerase
MASAALLLAACGDDDSGEPTVSGPCESVSNPPPREVNLDPPPSRPPARKLTAVVETSCGTFEIALDTRQNPKTTASFAYLAENGVYDDTPIHRIAVQPPVVQGGDPLGSGVGDAGYTIDEPPPPDTAYTRGIAAMAKTSAEPPGRSGSQFFVVTAADAGLPPAYALLGKVSKGFGVIETITQYGDPTGQTETPLEPVVIDSVTIEEG